MWASQRTFTTPGCLSFAVTDEQGSFKIDGIPPGKYRVTLWHEGFARTGVDKDGRPVYEEQRLTKEVTVPRGGSVSLDFEMKSK